MIVLFSGIAIIGCVLFGVSFTLIFIYDRLSHLTNMNKASSHLRLKRFVDLSPRDFELAMCAYFEQRGYAVQHTGRGSDGGIDIRMSKDGLKFVAQCKRYALDNSVGVEAVRAFYGVIASDNIARGFFITTSRYTKAAKDFARDKQSLTLIDGDKLKG